MKRLIALIIIGLTITACTNEGSARNALEGAGYTKINFTGYDFFSCAKGDFYHTGFQATGPTGKTISGTVCEGLLFKNSTIRFK
jgi:hypothetical protein